MMIPTVETRDLTKSYLLGDRAPIVDELIRLARVIGRDKDAPGETVQALRDVTFSANPGESIGLVGFNGAGKTTLLRILSGITRPTRGEAVIRGRTVPILDVTAGFHTDLTGRENAYFTGAILGMSKREIREKMASIAAMADVERFLDTPVKRFSRGMYLRLGFAVAAHLAADLLLVDEVLAAADGRFRGRCQEVLGSAAAGGTCVLIASHELDLIENLCSRVLLLDAGRLVADGPTAEVLGQYRELLRKKRESQKSKP